MGVFFVAHQLLGGAVDLLKTHTINSTYPVIHVGHWDGRRSSLGKFRPPVPLWALSGHSAMSRRHPRSFGFSLGLRCLDRPRELGAATLYLAAGAEAFAWLSALRCAARDGSQRACKLGHRGIHFAKFDSRGGDVVAFRQQRRLGGRASCGAGTAESGLPTAAPSFGGGPF